MGIVRFALRFPHTFYVMALAILFLGISAIFSAPKDIFPSINIPVVSVIWQYTGLTPAEMQARVTTYSEYSISSNVNNIRNIESQTLSGISVEKIYFQPDVNVDLAISQIVSASNSIRALMPNGIEPPTIVQYSASAVPVLQLSLSSDRMNEQQLYDYGIYQLRQALAPIQGITLPTPYGGKYRQIMVDIDPDALRANGLTPNDIVNAVNAQSLTLPSGDVKIGDKQYIVSVDAMAPTIQALNRIPIRQIGATTVHLDDVAHVRDGWAVQQNIVHTNGRRSVLLTIIKNGNASTLDVVNRVKAAMPEIERAAPPGMDVRLLFDQSVFVQQAIDGVLHEGAIAAALTALMILIFLGSWRSTLIVMVSIPLSILCSIAVLTALGQTINTMTLGGMALAVGILVDDFDGRDRKHPPPVRRRPRLRRGGARRLGRHCSANPCFDAGDQQRLSRGLLSARPSALPLCAARHGRRLRDDHLLCDLPHAHPDHHPSSAARRTGAPCRRPCGQLARPLSCPVQ